MMDQQSVVFQFDDVRVDVGNAQILKAGQPVPIEPKAFRVLVYLLENPGRVVEKDELLATVWQDTFVTENALTREIGLLRKALGDSKTGAKYIETVPTRGYRFVAKVARRDAPDAGSLASEGIPRGAHMRTMGALAAVALTLAVGLIWFAHVRSSRPASPNGGIRSLVVLPLQNFSGKPEQEYLADGMTEALIARLSAIHGLRVISRTSAMQFKGTQKPVPTIGKELNVDAVIEGSVLRSGEKIRVTVQLIRAATDEHLWADTYDRELRDVLELQSDVTNGIARHIEAAVAGAQKASRVTPYTVAPDAYEAYLKGRFALNKGDRAGAEQALKYFQSAIDADHTFAPAYAGVAVANDELSSAFLGGVPPGDGHLKMIAAARKALELDPDLAEARVVLAIALQRDWHWEEAEAEYRRAIELSPSDATAHAGLADWLLCQGRLEEALSSARRAQELDPLALHGIDIGWILFCARRYDEAIRELRTVLTIEPENPVALWYLGFPLISAEQYDEAIRVLERAASVSHRSSAVLGVLVRAYALGGRRAEALRILDELQQRRYAGYVPAAAFLNAYLGLDDKEEAFTWLGYAAEERSNIIQYLKVHPFFDPLRGDPRFADLIRRVGLG
jgi:TolB-like protein/DNA-binding winged helix-turn-helix (wHTH) protein/tetratricopeptide (TPR) repeat protein